MSSKTPNTPERRAHLKAIATNLDLPYYERWRAMADLAAAVNPLIKREQDQYKKEMAEFRANREPIDPDKVGGLKFRVSVPNMTWLVIASTDPGLVFTGKTNDVLQSRKTNKLVRKLDRAFPEYRAYRTE